MEENLRNNVRQEEESSINILDLWHLFWDHKWWYVASVVLCVIAAAFYVYRSPALYSRSAKVIIDEGSQEAAMRDLSSFTGTMSRLRFSTNVDNEVEAFSSPDLMEIVATRLGLLTSYYEKQTLRTVELSDNTPVKMVLLGENPASSFSFRLKKLSDTDFSLSRFAIGGQKSKELERTVVNGSLLDTLETPVGRIVLVPTENISLWNNEILVGWSNAKAVAKRYTAAMDVSISGKQTSVVVLSIKDRFPKRAENILNSLIDAYNESWVLNRNKAARVTTEFINDRLVVIEQELGGIESDLKNYKERNNLTDIKSLSDSYLSESSQYATRSFELSNQLSIANFIKDYLNDPAHVTSLIPANSGLKNGSIETQVQAYNELVLRRDNLLANTVETSPLVLDINTSLASIRSAILRSIENYITSLKIETDQVASQEKLILSRIAASSGQELELISIERQRKVKESLYVYLLQKREENELTSLMNVANTRLIMAPNGSSSPVEPRSMMILLVALVLGAGIPFAFYFLRKTLNNTVETKSDIVDSLSLPYLAEIPFSGKRRYFPFNLLHKVKDSEARPLLVRQGERNVINESFRVFRTNVDLMLNSNGGCRKVMVTSLYPGSGKTFICLNLAASMAVKGARTLMIDLDMRKASLSSSFNCKAVGVSSYLNGNVEDPKDCLNRVEENLYLIRVGVLPPNPTELLLNGRLAKLLDELSSQFDYIFIDCPPAEVVADAAIISGVVDMTVFVIRAGLMDKRNLPVVQELADSGRYKRMSVVLNGIEAHSGYSGRYGYYYRSYGYKYESDSK